MTEIASSEEVSLFSEQIKKVLPNGFRCKVYVLQSIPHKAEALFKGKKAPSPLRESFLLLIACDGIFIFAMEVLSYKTPERATVFVSKADSTGYSRAPLRDVATVFLSTVISSIKNTKSLGICLFARAQNNYVFVESSRNPTKHILDDYGLIKWWLRVLDPIKSVTNHVMVPGLSKHEIDRLSPSSKWVVGSPFAPDDLAKDVIPHFDDDPKARFLDEIIFEGRKVMIHEFWESMAFRQECSLGRLTGFMWVDVEPTSSGLKFDEDAVLLEQKAFQRSFDMLLREDFSTKVLAKGSTRTWIEGIGHAIERSDDWGGDVTGTKHTPERRLVEDTSPNILAPRKKAKIVNVIDDSMIRRKER